MRFITDLTTIGLILSGLSLFSGYEGKPVTRRAVSEMQLMHNYGDFMHTLQRQDWLHVKLQNLHPAPFSTPQESTPKVTESKPQKSLKKEKLLENRTKLTAQQNQRTSLKRSHRHGTKNSTDHSLKPNFQ